MKPIVLTALVLLLSLTGATAQGKHGHDHKKNHHGHVHHGKGSHEKVAKNIPTKVAEAFYREYPKAVNTVWTKQKGSWKATFNQGLFRKTATYHSNGQKLDTQTVMRAGQAPKPVLREILRRFPVLNKETEVTRFEQPGGAVRYLVNVWEAGSMNAYSFTEDGKIVK